MKQILYSSFIFLLFILMLLFPNATFIGAQDGLILWFETLLPTLLPFIIFSNLLIKTNSVKYISKILHPIFRKLFCVSPAGSYAVLVGFLCGYPMGAKTINDLIVSNQITEGEGKYLLSFCNNTSPMFILGFIVSQCFGNTELTLPTMIILYSSPILCSFIFRKKYKMNLTPILKNNKSSNMIHFDFSIIDTSIMNGFEIITKIGGYIILFSILFSILKPLNFIAFLPFLEVTNGIPCLLNANYPFYIQYTITLSSIAFGGLCAFAQTYSVIQDTNLSIISYTEEKLITTMVTSLLSFLYAFFILQ